MKIYALISSISLQDGKFLPKFEFVKSEGGLTTFTPYSLSIKEGVCNSKEKALENAKIHARRQVIEEYGKDVQLFIKEED